MPYGDMLINQRLLMIKSFIIDYHVFGDIDTSKFIDDALVWHKPEFIKKNGVMDYME